MNNQNVELGGAKAWLMWIIATTFVLFLFNLQTGYNIINIDIKNDLSLQVAEIGFIASIYTVIFAICQLFSGALLDRFGVRFIIPCSILIVALGALTLAKATSYEMLMLSQVIMAIGSAFGFVGAGFVGGEWFGGAKYGFMFGLVQSAASFGSLFGGNILNVLLEHFDWRTIIEYFSYFGFTLSLIAFTFMRDNKIMASTTNKSLLAEIFSELLDVAKTYQIWLSAFIGAALFGSLLSLAVIWASKVVQSHGIPPEEANIASLMIWLGMGLGAMIMDKLSRMMKSRKKVLLINSIIFSISLIALLYLETNVYLAGLLIFIMGFSNGAHMLSFTMAGEMVPIKLEGTSAAITNGTMFITGGVLISLPGYLLPATTQALTASDFQLALMPIWILNFVAVGICAFFLKDTYKAD